MTEAELEAELRRLCVRIEEGYGLRINVVEIVPYGVRPFIDEPAARCEWVRSLAQELLPFVREAVK